MTSAGPDGPMTLEEFRDHVLASVERVGSAFTEPDDDWVPVLMLRRRDTEVVTVAVGDYMSSEARKDALGLIVLPDLVREHDATHAAFIASVWMAPTPSTTPIEVVRQMRASKMDGRVEAVTVLACDGQRWQMVNAKIKRYRTKPPTLMRWEGMSTSDNDDHVEGRMFEPLVAAMRDLAETREA